MDYNEKTAEQIRFYFETLVDSQPSWIRRLFDEDIICFALSDEGDLELYIDKSISKKRLEKINRNLAKYLECHDAPFLKKINIH